MGKKIGNFYLKNFKKWWPEGVSCGVSKFEYLANEMELKTKMGNIYPCLRKSPKTCF